MPEPEEELLREQIEVEIVADNEEATLPAVPNFTQSQPAPAQAIEQGQAGCEQVRSDAGPGYAATTFLTGLPRIWPGLVLWYGSILFSGLISAIVGEWAGASDIALAVTLTGAIASAIYWAFGVQRFVRLVRAGDGWKHKLPSPKLTVAMSLVFSPMVPLGLPFVAALVATGLEVCFHMVGQSSASNAVLVAALGFCASIVWLIIVGYLAVMIYWHCHWTAELVRFINASGRARKTSGTVTAIILLLPAFVLFFPALLGPVDKAATLNVAYLLAAPLFAFGALWHLKKRFAQAWAEDTQR